MLIEKPYKIALIDDEPSQVELLQRALRKVDRVTPVTFTHPEKALEAIEKDRIRGVITDINMGNYFGDDLLRACNALHLGIQVYVVTGQDSMLIADRCLNLGARSVIKKPIDIATIRKVAEEIADHLDQWNSIIHDVAKRKAG